MKRKGLIAITAFAMVLGVGVAVGAHQEAEPVSAASKTVYCKVDKSWWKTDGAAVGAHYWVSDSDKSGTTWPGVRMASVTTDTDVWRIDIPDTYSKVIFTRVNGSGEIADWGAKTADLDIPTNSNNLYTITSDSAVWGDPGVTGTWSAYVEPGATYTVNVYVDGVSRGPEQVAEGALPVEPSKVYGKTFSGWFDDAACSEGHQVTAITSATTVYGKMNNTPTVTYSLLDVYHEFGNAPYVYAFTGTNIHNHAWPGVLVGESITVPNDAKIIINNNNDKQTADIVQSGVTNDKLVITGNTLEAVWYSTLETASDEGYFIIGKHSGLEEPDWSFAHGIAMHVNTPEEKEADEYHNDAKLENHAFASGDKIKVRNFYKDRYPFDDWFNCWNESSDFGAVDGDGNFVFSKSGNYNIHARYQTILEATYCAFFVSEYVEPVAPDVPEGGYGCYICGDYTDYKFDGAQAMTVISPQEEVDKKGYNAYKLSFHLAAGEAIKPRCYYSDRLDPNDQWAIYDGAPDSTYGELDEYGNFKAKVAGDYDIYTKFEDRNSDSKEEYYFHVVNHKFSDTVSVTIGENTVNMTKVDKDTNKEQYEATLNVATGDTVSFKVGSAAMSPTPNGDDSLNNNVDKSCNKIIETKASAKVFLKVDYEGNVTFWIEGRNFEFYLVTDEYLGMGDNPSNPDEVMRTNVALEAGDTLDFYCLTRFAPSGDNFHLGDKIPGAFTSDGSKVTCVKSGTYNFYLDDSAGDHSVLWIVGQTDADVKATAFANFFMGKFENGNGHTGVCHADGSTDGAVISSTWGECIAEYNSSIKGDSEAEGILRNALASGDELYNLFADLYDTIYVKYGKDLVNFAGRSVTPTGGAIDGFVANDSFPTITVVAITLAISAYLSFTALIIIKRKRTHK